MNRNIDKEMRITQQELWESIEEVLSNFYKNFRCLTDEYQNEPSPINGKRAFYIASKNKYVMNDKMRLSLQYGDLKADFEGTPEEVTKLLIRFLEQNIPTYSIARRITLTVDLESLVDAVETYIGYSKDDGFFLKPGFQQLPSSDQILLLLAKRYLENIWGITQTPAMSMREISEKLGLKEGTSSSRLTELIRKGMVRRLERGDYTITTLGLQELMKLKKQEKP
ncbi:MAG: winged helix-turn-helix transcriptional regulator [Nitrososphaerota archaeon]